MATQTYGRQLHLTAQLLGLLWLWGPSPARALSIDWSGQYRMEYVDVDHSQLKSGGHKSYLLNNLVLQPHLYPTDGFEVIGKVHLTPNTDPRYVNSQMGMLWGNSRSNSTTPVGSTTDESDVLAQNRPQSSITVSQLYLKIKQEWGGLILGRAPMQFGLGINHNAGTDPFAHWYDTRDTLSYQFHIGNVLLSPSISKSDSDDFAQGNEITTQSYLVEYNNTDNGDLLGLLYETIKGSKSTNDIPMGDVYRGGMSLTSYGVVFGKAFDTFSFKVEGAFMNGSTGTYDNLLSDNIDINSFAMVSEFNLKKANDVNEWKLKLGTVSGDNPNTADFEGYFLDRNYDVALLLFNQPLGNNADIFKTQIGRKTSNPDNRDAADDEYISNVLFVAPQWSYQLADRWNMRNTLIYAKLNNTSIDTGSGIEDIDSNVGFEWDLGFSYKANANLEWKINSGVLFPGKAFSLGSANHSTSTVIGLTTAAAITF